jgi:hypothetical protein
VHPSMAPPEDSAGSRGRRRSHHACLTCRSVDSWFIRRSRRSSITVHFHSPLTHPLRSIDFLGSPTSREKEKKRKTQKLTYTYYESRRKKSRCPGEKPACSSCVRLNQSCSYPPAIRSSHQSGRSVSLSCIMYESLHSSADTATRFRTGGEAGSLGRETRFPLEWEPVHIRLALKIPHNTF